MTHEVKQFNSEVMTDAGAIARREDRAARKERERAEREEDQKRIAHSAAQFERVREENRLNELARVRAKELAQEATTARAVLEAKSKAEASAKRIADQAAAKEARLRAEQEARAAAKEERRMEEARARKEQKELQRHVEKSMRASTLLDELTDSGDAMEPEQGPSALKDLVLESESHPSKESAEPLMKLEKGAILIPSFDPLAINHDQLDWSVGPGADLSSRIDTDSVYDLRDIMPAPTVVTVASTQEADVRTEDGQALIAGLLNENAEKEQADTASEIRSKRGALRMQRILSEKRELEKQLTELQAEIGQLKGVALRPKAGDCEIEVVCTKREKSKKQAALVEEAKLHMMRFLNTRENEVDHAQKLPYFQQYIANPFYMQSFVKNNLPEDWQGVLEFIYDSIQMPESDLSQSKRSIKLGPQPIRSRTATLGSPLVHGSKPIERITEHLSNMGI